MTPAAPDLTAFEPHNNAPRPYRFGQTRKVSFEFNDFSLPNSLLPSVPLRQRRLRQSARIMQARPLAGPVVMGPQVHK